MKTITGIIETALYTKDIAQAVHFYETILGLKSLTGDARFHAFSVADRHVLLLFLQGTSLTPSRLPGGVVPPHDGTGAGAHRASPFLRRRWRNGKRICRRTGWRSKAE
ncbi:VOC family protein [Chthoniobacter flavus]|nr:VOC family protein [Chthoniobacter flavus]